MVQKVHFSVALYSLGPAVLPTWLTVRPPRGSAFAPCAGEAAAKREPESWWERPLPLLPLPPLPLPALLALLAPLPYGERPPALPREFLAVP